MENVGALSRISVGEAKQVLARAGAAERGTEGTVGVFSEDDAGRSFIGSSYIPGKPLLCSWQICVG